MNVSAAASALAFRRRVAEIGAELGGHRGDRVQHAILAAGVGGGGGQRLLALPLERRVDRRRGDAVTRACRLHPARHDHLDPLTARDESRRCFVDVRAPSDLRGNLLRLPARVDGDERRAFQRGGERLLDSVPSKAVSPARLSKSLIRTEVGGSSTTGAGPRAAHHVPPSSDSIRTAAAASWRLVTRRSTGSSLPSSSSRCSAASSSLVVW